jgi:capsid protein
MSSNGHSNGHLNGQYHDRFLQAKRNSEAVEGFYQAAMAASRGGDAFDQKFAQQMDQVHASYFAGQTTRFLPRPPGVGSLGSGADYHYQNEQQYLLMIERARHDDRDNMVVGQGVSRAVANVVQDGFGLQIQTGDDTLDVDLMGRWREWAGNPELCDYDGERDYEQIARGLLRDRIVAGDIFGLPTTRGSLQIIENHQCRNPFGAMSRVSGGSGIVHGVEISGGKRSAFHFTPDDLSPGAAVSRRTRMRRIPARDSQGNRQVMQIYDPRRFTQRRGVTTFAPIVFPTRYHDDLQFAALVNAKRQSFIAIVRQLAADMPQPPGRDRQAGTRTEVTRDDGTTRTDEAGSPGQTIRGNPGEEIKPWSANIPAPAFFDHSALLLGIIAINLDLPPMVFMLDASQTNFNGYRGVIDQARMRFTQIQTDLIAQFHRPCYLWKIRQWIQADPAIRSAAKRDGVNIFGHRWTPRGWPYIQPVQDAAADDLRLAKNLISGRRRAQERGIDYDDLTTEIVEDRATLVLKSLEAAERINEQYKDAGISWRELAYGGDTAVKVSLTGTLEDGDTKPAEQPAKPTNEPAKKESTRNDQAE